MPEIFKIETAAPLGYDERPEDWTLWIQPKNAHKWFPQIMNNPANRGRTQGWTRLANKLGGKGLLIDRQKSRDVKIHRSAFIQLGIDIPADSGIANQLRRLFQAGMTANNRDVATGFKAHDITILDRGEGSVLGFSQDIAALDSDASVRQTGAAKPHLGSRELEESCRS